MILFKKEIKFEKIVWVSIKCCIFACMEQVSGFYFPPSETTSAQFSNMTEISASGFNILIRAKRDGRWWILKALAPAVRNSEVYQSLLQKEFDIMKHVQHPGVAEVMGIEEVDGYGKCLVMEWIDGVTLEEWLQQHHSKAERVHIANQLLVVLEFVHDMQVVHRDLKPSNMMITRNGSVLKLIDFGLADADSYAVLKEPAGTDGYVSPEQQKGGPTDVRNDIYSVGVILDKMRLNFSYRLGLRRCLRPLAERYPNMTAMRQHIRSLHRNLLAFWIASGMLVAGTSGVLIYNKVNEPPRGYDVVAKFKVGNLAYKSWGGGVVSVKAANSKDSCIEVPKTVNFQGMTYKIDEIEKKAFANQPDLRKLVFPDTKFHVMKQMVENSPNLHSICFRSALPPVIGNAIWKTRIQDVFSESDFKRVILYVPKGSFDAYRNSAWNQFENIIEYE